MLFLSFLLCFSSRMCHTHGWSRYLRSTSEVNANDFEYSKTAGITIKGNAKRIVGFSKYREFYSPQYTPENIDSPEPDHRTTLYWDPDVTTENGKAELSFLTADDLGYYRIIVEGVTDNGRICLGSAKFAVNRRNENPIGTE